MKIIARPFSRNGVYDALDDYAVFDGEENVVSPNFRRGDPRRYGAVAGRGKTALLRAGNLAAVQYAIDNAALEDGARVRIPWCEGFELAHGLLWHHAVPIEGEGWSVDQNHCQYAAAGWNDATLTFGSVLAFPHDPGTDDAAFIVGENGELAKSYHLRNVLVVGPGAGLSVGVEFGDAARTRASASSDWTNVLIGNWPVGLSLGELNQCVFNRLKIRGCKKGIVNTRTDCNANKWFGLEFQGITENIWTCPALGAVMNGNYIDFALVQGCTGDGIQLYGSQNHLVGGWWENTTMTGDEIRLAGAYNNTIEKANGFSRPIRIQTTDSNKAVLRDLQGRTGTAAAIIFEGAADGELVNVTGFDTITSAYGLNTKGLDPVKIAFADGDTTPSVAEIQRGKMYAFVNSAATNVTALDDPVVGEIYTVISQTANTTLKTGVGNLVLKGNADRLLALNEVVQFACIIAGRLEEVGGQYPSSAGGAQAMIVFGGSLPQVPASTTNYATPGVSTLSATESVRQFLTPIPKTFSRLYLQTNIAQPADGALTLTLRVNGVNTGLQVTVPAGAAAGVYTDLVNSVPVAAGDLISFAATNASPTSASAQLANASVQFA